jgi:putative exosortase-associated protein (TIGR04073 family)
MLKRVACIAMTIVFMSVGFLSMGQPSGFAEEEAGPKDAKYFEPSNKYSGAVMDRFGSGLRNIVYGPAEVVYRWKEEVKNSNLFTGSIPGLVRGVSWFAAREVVGVFEICTSLIPVGPGLPEFETDWLSA